MDLIYLIASIIGLSVLFGVGAAVVIAKFYRKVDQGQALIINKMKEEPEVTFTGGVVYPIIHKAETMDISVKTITIDRRYKDGLICKDNIRADISVTFFVRVNKTKDDVLKVAGAIGCARASDSETLNELFAAKFSEALKTAGKAREFTELYTERADFKDDLLQVIGQDLNGYVLDDAAIDFLEMTDLKYLDPNNILDAQGIRKIRAITEEQKTQTNILMRDGELKRQEKDVETKQNSLLLEKQQAEAEVRQKREIEVLKQMEEAESLRVKKEKEEELKRISIAEEEKTSIDRVNQEREVEVNRLTAKRVIVEEEERVERARQLEVEEREKVVALSRMDKQEALARRSKEIEVVERERVAVERERVEEEERIKDTQVLAEANRVKEKLIIESEAQAEADKRSTLLAAEAKEKAAAFSARERIIEADAAKEAADRQAAATIRQAEAERKAAAASGLAQAEVKEADAIATEKMGLAEARVIREKMEAEAAGQRTQGMAEVEVRDAQVEVTQREGAAQAEVREKQLAAEAAGAESQGMAQVRVKEAEAAALEKQGIAEAARIRERLFAEAQGEEASATALEKKLVAEAAGLKEKADALQAMEGTAREHEEFRIGLEKAHEAELRRIEARVQMARAQAEVLGEAFGQSEFRIVGGDGAFFDRFVKAVSMGESLDGMVDSSKTMQTAFRGYLEGERDLPEDLTQVLQSVGSSSGSEALKDLSIAATLSQLASRADGSLREKLLSLAAEVGEEP